MKEFERKILEELLENSGIKSSVLARSEDTDTVEFTGAGYFLTVHDPALPGRRVVLDTPDIRGRLGGVQVGYVAFIENFELKLECYTYDEEVLPKHRDHGFLKDET